MNSMTCPHCAQQFKSPSAPAGQTVRCPACKKSFALEAEGARRTGGTSAPANPRQTDKPDERRPPESAVPGRRKRKHKAKQPAASIPTRVWILGGAAAGAVI